MRMADLRTDGPPGAFPEYAAMPDVRAQRRRARLDAALGLGALAAIGGFALARAFSASARRGTR